MDEAARVPALPARAHAPGLEVPAVAAGGDFAVAVLAGQPDFQVVGDGGGEAGVAGGQDDAAVRQLQALQHDFGVPGQFFEGVVRAVGVGDLHQLHLLELVLAEHAAGVLAVGAGLGAETGGVGGVFERQFGFVDDLAGDQVGERDFAGGDQVAGAFALDAEQVLLELGELAGAHQRFGVDDEGHVGFGVAVFAHVQVQHELDQGAVHHGEVAGQDGVARAGQACGGAEVHLAERFAQGDMVGDAVAAGARVAPALQFAVGAFVGAVRDGFIEQVGQVEFDLA